MLRSNSVFPEVFSSYREMLLMEDKDVAFLVKFMKDRFMMNTNETICEIYFNY